MRKLKLLMVALLAMIGSSAYAAGYVIDKEFTSVSELNGVQFSIVNKAEGKAVYNNNNQNMAYADYATAMTGASYQYVLVAGTGDVEGCYLLKVVKADGSDISLWGNPSIYINSGAPGAFNGCFVLGLNGQNGQDVKNGAVWELEYVAGQGFTLKNKACGGYFAGASPRPDGTTPIYWTFCTLREATMKDELDAAVERAKLIDQAAAMDPADLTSLQDVISSYEGQTLADDHAYDVAIAAIETAITNANASIALHKAWADLVAEVESYASAKMSTAATTAYGNLSTAAPASESDADYTTAYNTLNGSSDIALVRASVTSYKVIAAGVVPDNSLDGWVCENTNTFHINTWSDEGNSDGSNMKTPFIENWVGKGSFLGAGKVYYKLEGLEPGEVYYAQALVRSYNEASSDAPNGPNFFINDQVVDMTSEGTTFTYKGMSGIYATLGGAATVGSDGTLTLGVKINDDVNYNWVAFKSVTIKELGAAYNAAIAKITALEGKIPTAEYAKAQAVVAANSSVSVAAIDAIEAAAIEAQTFVTPYSTSKNLLATATSMVASYPNLVANATAMSAAIEAATDVATLNEYISKMNVAITIFNEWLAVKASAEKLAAVPNDNPAANTGFVNTIAAKEADVQAVSDLSNAAVIGTTTNQLKSEILNYVADANPTGDNKFDLTFLLTNPNLEGLPTWQKADGWKTEQTSGNSQVMINDNATSEDGTKKAFFEYWNNPPQSNGKFALYLETTLPEGTYNMSCYAFSQDESVDPHVQRPNGVYFYANETQGSAINSLRLAPASIEFVNASEQSVKIGLKTVAGNGNTWMGIGYVELYKVAPKSYEIAETANYDASTEGAGDVKVTRTIKAGYNTLVLPFSLTQAEVETAFGTGSKVYEISKYENENISFAVRSGIVANEPVILYATTAGTSYTFEGRTVVATTAPVKTVDEVKFVGNYETGYAVAKDANNYVLSDGKFYLVTTDVTLKTTRAFITVPASAPVAARLNITFEDGDATAIDQIATESTTVKGIYNLQGQQLNSLQRGINIVNGKKVLVK